MTKKTFVIAEIGINHNGDLSITKKLIDGAVEAGCDAVKFQKRDIDQVYTQDQLNSLRPSPWGTTYREQKEGLEFGLEEYQAIDEYCQSKGIQWFASAWDVNSQNFLKQFNLKYNKVASALLTHRELVEEIAKERKYTFISTGMSTLDQIQKVVEIFREYDCPFELMHCNSEYPMPVENANLKTIQTLRQHFDCNVGYSGHETDTLVSSAAVALGATSIERHITLDKTMYGSDQKASIEIDDLKTLVSQIRFVEKSLGNGVKTITDGEYEAQKKLRTVDTL
jgi:N-acetylneuraminate synthase